MRGPAEVQRIGEVHAFSGEIKSCCDKRFIFDCYRWQPRESSQRVDDIDRSIFIEATQDPLRLQHDGDWGKYCSPFDDDAGAW